MFPGPSTGNHRRPGSGDLPRHGALAPTAPTTSVDGSRERGRRRPPQRSGVAARPRDVGAVTAAERNRIGPGELCLARPAETAVFLRAGSSLGPLLVGWIVADYGIRSVFAAFAVIALIGGLVALAFGIETKGRVLEELSP